MSDDPQRIPWELAQHLRRSHARSTPEEAPYSVHLVTINHPRAYGTYRVLYQRSGGIDLVHKVFKVQGDRLTELDRVDAMNIVDIMDTVAEYQTDPIRYRYAG
jgi:hypothetical protein